MEGLLEERGSFGQPIELHFTDNSLNPTDFDDNTLINHRITWFATSPVSVIGVVLNILMLYIWRQRERPRPLVFLFKVLAVFDILYLVLFNVWWYSPRHSFFAYIVAGLAFGSQYMLVNTTLLIGVWRWISVFRLEQSRKLLTVSRSRLAVGIIVTYCALVKITEHVVSWYVDDKQTLNVLSVVTTNVLLSAPMVLLAGLMISLVWVLCQVNRVLPDLSSTGHVHFHGHSHFALPKVRRLTYTIICITVSTFISYPVAGVVTSYLEMDASSVLRTKRIAFALSNFLYVLNSSIPFFFYFFFVHKFRKMCLLRFITLHTGTFSSKAISETEIHSEMVEPTNPHYPSSYRRSLVVFTEDGTLTVTGGTKSLRPSTEDGREERFSVPCREAPNSHPAISWAEVKVYQ